MAHLPSLARLQLHDIVSTEGGAGPQSKSNAQIVKEGVDELVEMIQVDKANICQFEWKYLERAVEISKDVIQASIKIARSDPKRIHTFGPNVRDVYAKHLPKTIQGRCVGQFLQSFLDKEYPPEPGRKRGIICDGNVCRLDD